MSSNNTRCAACKYLRKKCPSDCIYSPYFPSNNPQRFENVHKIYGASNIARMLQNLPVNLREEAANSLHYEAQCRVNDPVYGCVGIIYQLQQQINEACNQLVKTQTEIAFYLNFYGLSQQSIDDSQVFEEDYSFGFGSSYTRPNTYGLMPFDP